jgi:hypothetical protein
MSLSKDRSSSWSKASRGRAIAVVFIFPREARIFQRISQSVVHRDTSCSLAAA